MQAVSLFHFGRSNIRSGFERTSVKGGGGPAAGSSGGGSTGGEGRKGKGGRDPGFWVGARLV